MANSFKQIVRFLQVLDSRLNKKTDLFIIGGASITLFVDRTNRTVDIDAVEVEQSILDLAGKGTELYKQYKIYIQKVSEIGFSAPKDWRSKVHKIEGLNLKNLELYAADVHDVVLGKFARLEARDIKDMGNLFNKGYLDLSYLIQRLNQSTKELKKQEYRQNVKLAFDLIFNKKIIYRQGQAKISKD